MSDLYHFRNTLYLKLHLKLDGRCGRPLALRELVTFAIEIELSVEEDGAKMSIERIGKYRDKVAQLATPTTDPLMNNSKYEASKCSSHFKGGRPLVILLESN